MGGRGSTGSCPTSRLTVLFVDRETFACRGGARRWSGVRALLEEVRDEPLHPSVVRARPIHAPARGAATKRVVALADTERQIIGDFLLPDGLEEIVAAEAAPERNDGAEQVETIDDLGELAPGIDLPDAISVAHDPPLEQARIAGQEDPVLGGRSASDLLVARVVSPACVEAEHPQVSREAAEVPVEDEPDLARVRPRELYRLPVREDGVDLCMGDTKRFDDVLHGRAAAELVGEG